MNREEARKYMEMAVQVMKDSVAEPRSDGKVSPKVGAVLVKPDGEIETASRGEIRNGDHAEFTLLERKNRMNPLDGSIIFATLEPCAPGARSFPKLSCAERIVNARIKEVWIGVEDPDPTVDRKGIKYLQNNGVTVNIFDRDLQKEIEKDNAAFLKQAQERNNDSQKESVILSNLENVESKANFEDFSKDALERYRSKLQIKEGINSDTFIRKLYRKGVLELKDNQYHPTGLGLLLFGSAPEDFYPQSVFKGTVRYPGGKTEIQNFKGPIIQIPDQIEEWWYKVNPAAIDRSSTTRKTNTDFPYKPIREAVINAIVHRDYDINGATCHLDISADFVTVKSPGEPIPPITLEELNSFKAPSLSRNPVLFSIFAELEMVEQRGFGMETWNALPEEFDLPIPEYSLNNSFLEIQFATSHKSKRHLLNEDVRDKLNDEELKGYEFVKIQGSVSRKDYEEHFGYDARKANRHLGKLLDLGLISDNGKGKTSPNYRYVYNG